MASTTIGYAVILILLGLFAYFGTGRTSLTALIPAAFGIPILIAGMLARKESIRMHAMHAAVLLGLIAAIATFTGLLDLVAMLTGTEFDRPAAVITSGLMCLLSLVFVALCVRSFIAARVARRQQGE